MELLGRSLPASPRVACSSTRRPHSGQDIAVDREPLPNLSASSRIGFAYHNAAEIEIGIENFARTPKGGLRAARRQQYRRAIAT